MELLGEKEFVGGVSAAHGMQVKERGRQAAAWQRYRAMRRDGNQPQEDMDAAYDALEPAAPLWQQVCGFSPRNELVIEPGERRAGIRRLLRVVERMFRSEMKKEDIDADGGPEKLCDGEVSYGGRSAIWDPLNEICLYLEISKAKLNGLSVQRTGLRASDIGDCIRAEKVRVHLREKFGPLVWQWFGQLETEKKSGLVNDLENTAWRFLKWLRGGGRGETRKKLAFELGLTSREKLDRAMLIGQGETLEAMEVGVAMGLLREMLKTTRPTGPSGQVPDFLLEKSSHGAGCDEVGEEGDGPPPEEDIEERETA